MTCTLTGFASMYIQTPSVRLSLGRPFMGCGGSYRYQRFFLWRFSPLDKMPWMSTRNVMRGSEPRYAQRIATYLRKSGALSPCRCSRKIHLVICPFPNRHCYRPGRHLLLISPLTIHPHYAPQAFRPVFKTSKKMTVVHKLYRHCDMAHLKRLVRMQTFPPPPLLHPPPYILLHHPMSRTQT